MDRSAAEAALADAELIAYREGPIAAVKEFERECLAQEIPVLLAKGPPKACCGGGGCGCGAKIQLLAREEDIPRIEQHFRNQWLAHAKDTIGEDLVQLKAPVEVAEGEDPPCPACGHVGPLKEGACGDCGLQLE
ncbi:MAG: hypothetical protein JNK82_29965 [Myxococcaceae bacterium]|nr:hypothetical protein [Myxococcaceae bacterium]